MLHYSLHILSTGVRPEYTFVVGSPMAELLDKYRTQIDNSDILHEKRPYSVHNHNFGQCVQGFV